MAWVFLGIDLGTSGLRGVALSETGDLKASVSRTWPQVETQPQAWLKLLQVILTDLKALISNDTIAAISVCSTSGSILILDPQGHPLEAAFLYNDPRGREQAEQLGISPSWGLARWLWWHQTYPERSDQSFLAHPTDYLLQALGAEPRVTDHTCALKSGFDLEAYEWPSPWLKNQGLKVEHFPRVVAPGCPLGTVKPEWGLGTNVMIVAGCTDGCAGQLAAGAVRIGECSTSLGTTLIFKGISANNIQTADGSVYSHLHPDQSCWLPGAASSCGGGILNKFFPQANWADLDQAATAWIPTRLISYPLVTSGERFPLKDPTFPGILPAVEPGSIQFFAAVLEGVALVERLGLERLAAMGLEQTSTLYTTGGGSQSPIWLQIRASVLNRSLTLTQHPQPAVGAAMLAAAGWWNCSVETAVQRLVQIGTTVEPHPQWTSIYNNTYQLFLAALEES